MRRKRADGLRVDDATPDRQIIPFLMRGRNESAVYFEQHIDLERTEDFLRAWNGAHPDLPATLQHVVIWAAVRTLAERPHLNRFIAGGRIYQRDGIWISYSAKKQLRDGAPIVVIKRRFDPGQPFGELVRAMAGDLRKGRSKERSTVDKELSIVLALPGPLLRLAMWLQRAADALGLLPRAFIDNDPLYASLFVANLGSIRMDAAYHHLYEYGSISLFCVMGKRGEEPVAQGGQVVARRRVVLRFTYDERIEDGLYAGQALQLFQRLVQDPSAAGAAGA